jgi:hypothetical protein
VLFGLIPAGIGLIGYTLVPGLEDPEQVLPLVAQQHLPTALYALFAGRRRGAARGGGGDGGGRGVSAGASRSPRSPLRDRLASTPPPHRIVMPVPIR